MGLRTPNHKVLVKAATETGTFDFTKWQGGVYIRNVGPAIVYIKFDGEPATSPEDGTITLLVGEALSFYNIKFRTIGLYVTADPVGGAQVDVIALNEEQ